GRHEMKRVAELPSDRAFRHVGADEPHLTLAVLAEPAEQRCCPRGTGRTHEHRRHVRSIRSSTSCSSHSACFPSSIARIVSPIEAPSYTQISGCTSSCSHSKSPRASSSCGQPSRQRWFESLRQ